MLISQRELDRLIKEEVERAIEEGWLDQLVGKSAGLKSRAAGAMSGLGAKAARGLGATTAAADMEKAGSERKSKAADQEKLGLMKQHALKFQIISTDMIKDATQLGLLTDPNFKKALQAVKSISTRMNTIIAQWVKAGALPGDDLPDSPPDSDGGALGSEEDLTATIQSGTPVVYADAKGNQKKAVVVKTLDTKDAQGDPQIQLKSGSAVFAVDQEKVKKA